MASAALRTSAIQCLNKGHGAYNCPHLGKGARARSLPSEEGSQRLPLRAPRTRRGQRPRRRLAPRSRPRCGLGSPPSRRTLHRHRQRGGSRRRSLLRARLPLIALRTLYPFQHRADIRECLQELRAQSAVPCAMEERDLIRHGQAGNLRQRRMGGGPRAHPGDRFSAFHNHGQPVARHAGRAGGCGRLEDDKLPINCHASAATLESWAPPDGAPPGGV